MADKVWTAAQLEQMSPKERDELLASSIVTDLESVPAEFLDRVRRRASARIGNSGTTPS